jgi:hypothetical protein
MFLILSLMMKTVTLSGMLEISRIDSEDMQQCLETQKSTGTDTGDSGSF